MADAFKKDAAGKDKKAAMSTKGGKKGDTVDSLPAPPATGTSHFTFANGSTYDGQWTLLPAADPLTSPRTTAASATSAAAANPTDAVSGRKVREGRGRWVSEGDEYDGEWVADTMEGEGSMRFVGGATYTGQWKGGRYEGRGEYVWADGSRYVGEWKGGRMDGEGVLEVHGSSGDVQRWQGTFANDKHFDSSTGYWSALPTPMHLL